MFYILYFEKKTCCTKKKNLSNLECGTYNAQRVKYIHISICFAIVWINNINIC